MVADRAASGAGSTRSSPVSRGPGRAHPGGAPPPSRFVSAGAPHYNIRQSSRIVAGASVP